MYFFVHKNPSAQKADGFAVIHKQEALDYFAEKQRFFIKVEISQLIIVK